jgi:phosphotriesterase-related protein
MTRRQLLAAAGGTAALSREATATSVPGSTLVHEHLMVDFVGAAAIRPGRYDPDEVFRLAKPKLDAVYALGCRRFLDCVPNYLGRDPKLFRRIGDAAGIDVWTTTGLYAAGNYKYLPEFAKHETADQLARRWTTEVEKGVDGVKPRFIKIGVNKVAPVLGEWDRKLVVAAAMCAKQTGLTIASHTGDGAGALEQVEILSRLHDPRRFVWVHAQNELDHEIHAQVARAGAWVEFDGISEKTANWHEQCIRAMEKRGLLGQVLISQDSGWYRVGEPNGGEFRGYDYLYLSFLNRLPTEWHAKLLVDNPRRAFPQ